MTVEPSLMESSRILIVDDQVTVARALSTLLERAGFDTVICHSGADTLAAVESSRPCAAVIDIHLPDINGLLLAQMLRRRFGSDTPIIIVSGDNSMETIKSLQHVGATYFFSKPVNAAALVDRLKELLSTACDRAAG